MDILSRKDAAAQGVTRYFTGKPCSRGHVDYRHVKGGSCKSCKAEDTRRLRQTNPAYNDACKAISTAWKVKNKDALKEARSERWRTDEEYRNRCNQYIANNRERYRAYYRLANLSPERQDAARAKAAADTARRRNAEGAFSAKDVEVILHRQKRKCAECRADLRGGYHLDHILPVVLGGSNWPSNLQCLCQRCNLSKGAKHPIEWAQRKGRLL